MIVVQQLIDRVANHGTHLEVQNYLRSMEHQGFEVISVSWAILQSFGGRSPNRAHILITARYPDEIVNERCQTCGELRERHDPETWNKPPVDGSQKPQLEDTNAGN